MTEQEIKDAAKKYADETFTEEFVGNTSDAWYYEALDWFNTRYENKSRRCQDIFGKEITHLFYNAYNRYFGRDDDLADLRYVVNHGNNETLKILKMVQSHGHFDVSKFITTIEKLDEEIKEFVANIMKNEES